MLWQLYQNECDLRKRTVLFGPMLSITVIYCTRGGDGKNDLSCFQGLLL